MVPLQPATWTITALSCASLNRQFNFRGSVAQIRIDPGEIVNAGTLTLEVSVEKKGTFFSRPVFGERGKVGELLPDTAAALRTRAPDSFAKAKRRSFVIVNP